MQIKNIFLCYAEHTIDLSRFNLLVICKNILIIDSYD